MKIIFFVIASFFTFPSFAVKRLEVMVPSGNYVSFMRNTIVPEFKKLHPDVDLVVSNDERMDTRMAAGDNPNVYLGVFGYQPAYFAKLGKLAYLDKFKGFSKLINQIDSQFLQQNFGRTYYIPWNVTTQMMIYNKSLFTEAGLDPNQPPETWTEFLEDIERISALPARKKDNSKVYGTVFWNDALSSGSWYWNLLAPIYYNVNQGRYQLLNSYGTDIVFDKPEARMTEFFSLIKKAQKFAPPSMGKSFFSRNIGIWLQFGFSWKASLSSAASFPMVIGDDVGIAPIPVMNKGDTSYSTLDGRAIMIFKSTRKKEELSWDLVNLLMREDINLKANIELGQLPTLKALKLNPYFQSKEVKPFIKQLEHALPSEPYEKISAIADVILSNYARVILKDELTPKQAVFNSAKTARKLLNQ